MAGMAGRRFIGEAHIPDSVPFLCSGTNYTFRKVGRAIKRRPVKQQNKRVFSTYVGIRRDLSAWPRPYMGIPTHVENTNKRLRFLRVCPEWAPGSSAIGVWQAERLRRQLDDVLADGQG